MRKGTFCDSVLRLLSSGSYNKSEFLFQRRDVAEYLNDAIGKVIEANFFSEYNLGLKGNIDAGFLTTFPNVAVSFDQTRQLYYSDLPALPIALPSGLGVFEISPMQDQRSAFVPLLPGQAGLFKGLEAENLFGEVGARQEGRKIWYKNINLTGENITAVLMNIACDTETLSMDDQLPLPPNYRTQVREQVLNFMGFGLAGQPDSNINKQPNR